MEGTSESERALPLRKSRGQHAKDELEVLIVGKYLDENARNDDHEDPNEEDSCAEKQKQDEYPNDPPETLCPLK
jgi:hypothetical protein